MSDLQQHQVPTLESLAAEVRALKDRVEDLEDLREHGEAMARNAGKPLLDWEDVKKELDI